MLPLGVLEMAKRFTSVAIRSFARQTTELVAGLADVKLGKPLPSCLGKDAKEMPNMIGETAMLTFHASRVTTKGCHLGEAGIGQDRNRDATGNPTTSLRQQHIGSGHSPRLFLVRRQL